MEKTLSSIKLLVARGQSEKAIEMLIPFFKDKDPNFYNMAIMISSWLANLKKEDFKMVFPPEEIRVISNQINDRILKLVDEYQKELTFFEQSSLQIVSVDLSKNQGPNKKPSKYSIDLLLKNKGRESCLIHRMEIGSRQKLEPRRAAGAVHIPVMELDFNLNFKLENSIENIDETKLTGLSGFEGQNRLKSVEGKLIRDRKEVSLWLNTPFVIELSPGQSTLIHLNLIKLEMPDEFMEIPREQFDFISELELGTTIVLVDSENNKYQKQLPDFPFFKLLQRHFSIF